MIYWDGNFIFPYPTAGSAAVINDFAKFQNPSHGHCHNYFRGCRQREKKSPINDFLKRWWWHPGWQHRIAMGCVNQSRTIRIDFTLSLSPPYRTVSPELKSYALGVLFLLLRLLGRYKKISSSSPTLPSLTDNTIFNMQELISSSCELTHQTLWLSRVGSEAMRSRTSLWRMLHQGSRRRLSCHLDCANGRKCGVAWEMTISATLPCRRFSSIVVINMSAACKITAVLHIAEVEECIFLSSFEGQELCYMLCLSLPSGLSEKKTVRWDRLSPCTLLGVNIPLKCMQLFLWTSMCFSCVN